MISQLPAKSEEQSKNRNLKIWGIAIFVGILIIIYIIIGIIKGINK